MATSSAALALLKLKCPRCHEGDLFTNPNPYNFKTLDVMPEKCPYCGQRTEIEPGFYYGAMYCSYGLGMLLSLINFLICQFIVHVQGYWFLVVNAIFLLIAWPFVFRYARAAYFYIFVRYDPHALDGK